MSTLKHNLYRKVLQIKHFTANLGTNVQVPVMQVLWCTVNAQSSRTVKTDHIGTTYYVGALNFQSTSSRHFKKMQSLRIKAPMTSKCIVEHERYWTQDGAEALREAGRKYILGTPALSKSLTGIVKWFNRDSGSGSIVCNRTGNSYELHACNINGKKTWYSETACVYVQVGQQVTFDLADMGTHVTAVVTDGGVFDAAKWASLDQSKLTFKCDAGNNLISGMFASKES